MQSAAGNGTHSKVSWETISETATAEKEALKKDEVEAEEEATNVALRIAFRFWSKN